MSKKESLLDRIVTELGTVVAGEQEALSTLVLNLLGGRLVLNAKPICYHIFLNDESGAGKDFVARQLLELLDRDMYDFASSISLTSLRYWHANEKNWDWNGKVLYLEDIRQDILSSSELKVYLSNDGVSQSIVTVRTKGGWGAKPFLINGSPIVLITSALGVPDIEHLRRLNFQNLTATEEQTRAIIQKSVTEPKEYSQDLKKEYTSLKRVRVNIPYLEKVAKHFPANEIIHRTLFQKFVGWIKASAALEQSSREINKDGSINANQDDYEAARKQAQRLAATYSGIPLSLNRKKIVKYFEENPLSALSATELQANISDKSSLTLKSLLANLRALVSFGVLYMTVVNDSYGKERTQYTLSQAGKFALVSYGELDKEPEKVKEPSKGKHLENPCDICKVKEGEIMDGSSWLCTDCNRKVTEIGDRRKWK